TDRSRQARKTAGQSDFKAGLSPAATVPTGDQTFKACSQPEFIDVGRAQSEQRAAQRLHHVGGCPRNTVAFDQQVRTILCRALADRGSERPDRRQRLPEFVMKLPRQMQALLVLQRDQLPRQLVALSKCSPE